MCNTIKTTFQPKQLTTILDTLFALHQIPHSQIRIVAPAAIIAIFNTA